MRAALSGLVLAAAAVLAQDNEPGLRDGSLRTFRPLKQCIEPKTPDAEGLIPPCVVMGQITDTCKVNILNYEAYRSCICDSSLFVEAPGCVACQKFYGVVGEVTSRRARIILGETQDRFCIKNFTITKSSPIDEYIDLVDKETPSLDPEEDAKTIKDSSQPDSKISDYFQRGPFQGFKDKTPSHGGNETPDNEEIDNLGDDEIKYLIEEAEHSHELLEDAEDHAVRRAAGAAKVHSIAVDEYSPFERAFALSKASIEVHDISLSVQEMLASAEQYYSAAIQAYDSILKIMDERHQATEAKKNTVVCAKNAAVKSLESVRDRAEFSANAASILDATIESELKTMGAQEALVDEGVENDLLDFLLRQPANQSIANLQSRCRLALFTDILASSTAEESDTLKYITRDKQRLDEWVKKPLDMNLAELESAVNAAESLLARTPRGPYTTHQAASIYAVEAGIAKEALWAVVPHGLDEKEALERCKDDIWRAPRDFKLPPGPSNTMYDEIEETTRRLGAYVARATIIDAENKAKIIAKRAEDLADEEYDNMTVAAALLNLESVELDHKGVAELNKKAHQADETLLGLVESAPQRVGSLANRLRAEVVNAVLVTAAYTERTKAAVAKAKERVKKLQAEDARARSELEAAAIETKSLARQAARHAERADGSGKAAAEEFEKGNGMMLDFEVIKDNINLAYSLWHQMQQTTDNIKHYAKAAKNETAAAKELLGKAEASLTKLKALADKGGDEAKRIVEDAYKEVDEVKVQVTLAESAAARAEEDATTAQLGLGTVELRIYVGTGRHAMALVDGMVEEASRANKTWHAAAQADRAALESAMKELNQRVRTTFRRMRSVDKYVDQLYQDGADYGEFREDRAAAASAFKGAWSTVSSGAHEAFRLTRDARCAWKASDADKAKAAGKAKQAAEDEKAGEAEEDEKAGEAAA